MKMLYYLDKIVEYSGRFVGFIDEKQFAMLLKTPKLSNKLITSETMQLEEIVDIDCENMRLVFIAKDKTNEPHIVVSHPLECLYNCMYNIGKAVDEVSFCDKESFWLTLFHE